MAARMKRTKWTRKTAMERRTDVDLRNQTRKLVMTSDIYKAHAHLFDSLSEFHGPSGKILVDVCPSPNDLAGDGTTIEIDNGCALASKLALFDGPSGRIFI